jgi:hypothetical protein
MCRSRSRPREHAKKVMVNSSDDDSSECETVTAESRLLVPKATVLETRACEQYVNELIDLSPSS